MPDFIPPGLLDGLGTIGLVLLVFWLIVTGRLVTAREHRQVIHDRDEWRAESRLKDQQILEKDTQLRELSEVGRVVGTLVAAFQQGPRT